MHNLLDKIIKCVSDCLNYKIIQRKNKSGKRKESWKNNGNPKKLIFKGQPDYNYLSEAYYSVNFPQRFIYPKKVEIDFSLYKHEIRSKENSRLINWGDSQRFIEEEYINSIPKSQANSGSPQGTKATYNTVSSNRVQENIETVNRNRDQVSTSGKYDHHVPCN